MQFGECSLLIADNKLLRSVKWC